MLLYSANLQANNSCILPHSYANPQFSMVLNELEFAEGYYPTSHSIVYPPQPPFENPYSGPVTAPRSCLFAIVGIVFFCF